MTLEQPEVAVARGPVGRVGDGVEWPVNDMDGVSWGGCVPGGGVAG